MKSMLVCIVSAILLVFSTPVVAGDDGVERTSSRQTRINQRFSGVSIPTMVDSNGDESFARSFTAESKGSPGRSTTVAFAEWSPLVPGDCPFGSGLRAELVEEGFVQTYGDLSQLHFVGTTGFFCLNPDTFELRGEFDAIITGGTGRFVGVTGWATTEFEIFFVGNVSSIVGTTVGEIEFPRGW